MRTLATPTIKKGDDDAATPPLKLFFTGVEEFDGSNVT